MTHDHSARLLMLVGLLPWFATPVLAQEVGAYYGGLSVGQSRAFFDEPGISNRLLPPGVASTGLSVDDRDFAYRVFGGYQFHPNFAVEAGYFDLGKTGFAASTSPPGSLDANLKLRGLHLDLVGRMPIVGQLSAIARVGAQYALAQERLVGTGAVSVADSDPQGHGTHYKVGFGLQYEVSPSFIVRGEAERYRVSDALGNHGNVNLLSVSLVFPFGQTGAAPTRTSERAEPAARQAPPPPVEARRSAPAAVVAEPPAPLQQEPPAAAAPLPRDVAIVVPMTAPARRTDAAPTTQFMFDRSDVGPEGRTALDTFTKSLGGSAFDVITVEGHTDRLGTPAYNQALSLRRAQSVKAYLVRAARLDPAKISATGRGASGPVTRAGDCTGNAPSAALIECLQSDRRVELAVRGVR